MAKRREAARFLRRHRLGFVALSALGALVLGFIGYLQAESSVVNAAYGTLSLLAFNYDPPDGQVPFTLQVARFMVPAVAAFATFTALIALLEDQWHLVRARFCSDHVIVCGLGRRGMCLVRSSRLEARPVTVVAIETDRSNPNVEVARRLGVIVVIGDAAETDILHAAGVQRAETLISVLPSDAHNAAVASMARRLCIGHRRGLTALCHVSDIDLAKELTSAALGSADGGFTLEWFSVPERAARLMLAGYANLMQALPAAQPPHLVVAGDDDLARALVVNAARQWRAIAGGNATPLRITVACDRAGEWIERLADRHPSISRAAHLDAYEGDLRARARRDEARRTLDDAIAVFVCGSTDSEGLELGFAIAGTLTANQPVVVRLAMENAFEFLEPAAGPSENGSIRLFSVVDRTCSVRMVADGLNETLARALHDVYRRQPAVPGGEESERPLVPWEDLPGAFKQSSRAQAAHLALKLREARCGIRPLTDWDAAPLEFSEPEVERLAELEHVRWNEERKSQGWVAGPHTDRGRKVSEWIDMTWGELPAEIAEYDREFVRALPRALAMAGYELHRLPLDNSPRQ